ncbi:SGNH/GDSL hydrolase family protein [Mesomycoplasma conjunctivae]|uniref:SGNH/GDSL hydrolase family protein n=1 Tax=Mesomycoplasma conjunctivae TaxID=45361 RepID=UPI003DA2E9D1
MAKKAFIFNNSLKSFTVSTIVGITSLTLAACSPELAKNPLQSTNHNLAKSKRKTTLLSKVKYLAIGDSVTAGFNFDYFLDLRGKLENGKISGLSYPAFFAHFLQQVNSNSLVSFDNLALSGTTIEDWLYLLDASNPKYASLDKSFFKFNTNLNQVTNSPFGQQISDTFGDFSATSYPKFIAKIKDANLLTLTLGANDFIQSLDFSLLSKTFGASVEEKLQLGKLFVKNIELSLIKIKDNLAQLVGKLLEINPNLHINLLGYNHLGSTTVKFLEHLLVNELALEDNFSSKTIDQLNQIIQETALNYGLNYVNVFNDELWLDAKNGFAKNEFDIHPSTKGYKKMAQDLLLKLALDQDNLGQKTFKDILPTWNNKYINKDLDSYSRDLNVATNEQLLTFLTNQQKNDFVAKNSEYEQENEKNLQPFAASNKDAILSFVDNGNFLLQRFVSILGQNKQINEILKQLITNFFKKENHGNTNFVEFLKTFVNSNFFSKSLSNIATYIKKIVDNQDWSGATISKLLSYIQENLLTEENLVEAYKEFIKSDVIQKNETEVRSILFASLFGQSAIQDLLIDNLFNLEDQDKSKLSVIFNFPSLRKFVNEVFTEFILNYQKYNDASTFGEIISIFLSREDNQRNVINFTQNFASEALRQPIFTSFLVEGINKRLELNLSTEDKKLASDFLFGISDTLVRSQTISQFIRSASISLANRLKTIKFDKQNIAAFSKIFITKFEESFKTFFSEKDHIFLVIQDLLDLNLDKNQVNIIENLIQKGYPLLKTIDFNSIISGNQDLENYQPIFEAAKEFLTQEDYKNIDFLVKNILNDFFITHKNEYQASHNIDSFLFELLGYNVEKFQSLLYDFISINGRNEQVLSAIGKIIASFFKNNNLSDRSITTTSKIIREILQDFATKWAAETDKSSTKAQEILKGNILATFIEKSAQALKEFVTNNAQILKQEYQNYQQALKDNNSSAAQQAQEKWVTAKNELSFSAFQKAYKTNLLTLDNAYQFLKDFTTVFQTIDRKDKAEPNELKNVSIADLSLLLQDILKSPSITNKIISALNLDKLFKNSTTKEYIKQLYSKFINAPETKILLEGFLLYIFNSENQAKANSLLGLFANFLKQHHNLVVDALTIFADKENAEGTIKSILKELLDSAGIKLEDQHFTSLFEIAKKLISKSADAAKKQENGLFVNLDNQEEHQTNSKIRSLIEEKVQQTTDPIKVDNGRPLTITSLINVLSQFLSNSFDLKSVEVNKAIDGLVGNLIYDIAELYYKNKTTEGKTTENDKIANLIIAILNSDFIKNKIKEDLKTTNLSEFSSEIVNLFSELISSENTKTFVNQIFTAISKQNKEFNSSALSILQKLIKDATFKKNLGDFIGHISTADSLSQTLSKILNRVLQLDSSDQAITKEEVSSVVNWIKEILLDNVKEEQTNQHSYEDKNSVISKLLDILAKFLDSSINKNDFDVSSLKNELLNEEFIVDFIKQLAATYSSIKEDDKTNITQFFAKLLGSQVISSLINNLDFSAINTEIGVKGADAHVKKFVANLIKQPGHARFLFDLLETISKKSSDLKGEKTLPTLLKKLTESSEDKGGKLKTSFKQYLWEIIQFGINDEDLAKVIGQLIAKALNLQNDGKNYEKITNFLKELINLGPEGKIFSSLFDKLVDEFLKLKKIDTDSLTKLFKSLNFSSIFQDVTFLGVLNSLVSETKQADVEIALAQKEQKERRVKRSLPGQITPPTTISVETFSQFFDTIFSKSNKWNSTSKDSSEASPILKELNNIKYEGISFSDIFGSSQASGAQSSLEAISELAVKLFKSKSDTITKENYHQSEEGRNIYRLVFVALFYGYESKLRDSGLRSSGFYGGILSSSTLSEQVRKAFHAAIKKDANESKFKNLIDGLIGNPVKSEGWLYNTYYKSYDFNTTDMLTMIYYNKDKLSSNSAYKTQAQTDKLVTLKDLILELIRRGDHMWHEDSKK